MEMQTGQAYAIAIHWLDDVGRDWATPYIAGVNDSGGELITGTHSYGGNPNSVVNTLGEITFRALKSGTYYLEVKPSPCCDYALMPVPEAYSAEVHGADVKPDDVPKFEPLMLEFNPRGIKEVTFDGSIETFGDRDTFYFSGDVGNLHTITFKSGSGIFNCIHGISRLRTASQSMPDSEECSDRPYWKVSRLVTTRDEDGYLITAGSDDATGEYTLHVRDNAAMPPTMYDGQMPTSDIASDPGTEGLLYVNDSWANGTAVLGEIELALDTDWYRIELYANRRYQIDVRGASSDAGTIFDTDLWIFDADGNHIEGTFDGDSGSHLEARLIYGPPVSGTYLIQVGAGSYEIGRLHGLGDRHRGPGYDLSAVNDERHHRSYISLSSMRIPAGARMIISRFDLPRRFCKACFVDSGFPRPRGMTGVLHHRNFRMYMLSYFSGWVESLRQIFSNSCLKTLAYVHSYFLLKVTRSGR